MCPQEFVLVCQGLNEMPERFIEQFHVITRVCNGKLDCLVKEMLYTRMRKPTLNVQTDSIRANVSA